MNFTEKNTNSSACSFLRECDFAFRVFLKNSRLQKVLNSLGAVLVSNSNNLKFRKPLRFFQSFCILTRIAWWDDHSLFIEQKLIRKDNRAVCAINYSRQTVMGAMPQDVLDELPGCSCLPQIPPEIAAWMVCIKVINRELQLAGQC